MSSTSTAFSIFSMRFYALSKKLQIWDIKPFCVFRPHGVSFTLTIRGCLRGFRQPGRDKGRCSNLEPAQAKFVTYSSKPYQRMKLFFQRLLNAGIDPQLTYQEARTVSFLNGLVLLVLLLIVLNIPLPLLEVPATLAVNYSQPFLLFTG